MPTRTAPRSLHPPGAAAIPSGMPENVPHTESDLTQLELRLQQLEDRVALLEKRMPSSTTPVETILAIKPRETGPQNAAMSVIPILGKAVLIMAGAYLLRAVAESGAAPRRLLLIAAILYAIAWLVWAARVNARSKFASTIFALTSALILAPVLWEGTVRFQQLSVGFSSAALLAYIAISLALSWKHNLQGIPWIATATAVSTALALILATHELAVLTAALLAIALFSETVSWTDRWLGVRAITALGADFSVAILGIIMTSAQGVPASYRPMSAAEIFAFCIGFMLIYGISLAVRGFLLRNKWNFAEVAQAAVALALGTWLSLQATHGTAASLLGAAFLVAGSVFYWGALKRFASAEFRWNNRVSETFGVSLVLVGILLLSSGNIRTVLLSAAAIAAVVGFSRSGNLILAIHGTVYLLAACSACGMFGYAGRALAGSVPAWPQWSFWVAAAAGLVSYVLGSHSFRDAWTTRLFAAVSAAVVGFALAALAVAGLAKLGVAELSASRLSMVRTAVTCTIALALSYLSSRWNRTELLWVAYAAVALGALKLVFEDLRFGNAATLMGSFVFYGLVLILLPRLTRLKRA